MPNLINKTDFPEYVKFTTNVEDIDVDFECKDAQGIDFYPIAPTAKVSGNNMTDDIVAALAEDPITKPELVALFNNYLKPFLVCSAYARFLLLAGRNITQFGLRVINEETSTEVSDKGRSEMIKDINHKSNVYLAKFNEELKNKNMTFDSVVYEYKCSESPKAKTRFAAV